MKEEDDILAKFGKGNPFNVPDGYFDTLPKRIMDSLPEKKLQLVSTQRQNKWRSVRPWLYVAAAFIGLFFCVDIALHYNSRSLNKQTTAHKEQFSDQEVESMVDNSHMDDYSLYEYLSDAK